MCRRLIDLHKLIKWVLSCVVSTHTTFCARVCYGENFSELFKCIVEHVENFPQ